LKKICFIIPSLKSGGMERVACELANFSSKKVKTFLIILQTSDIFYSLDNEVELLMPEKKYSIKALNLLNTIIFLRSHIRKIKPDSILSFGETYNSFVILALIGLNQKIFVSDRSNPLKNWGIFHEILRKYAYRNAFGIISQTSQAKEKISYITGHKNVHIIPNATTKKKNLQNKDERDKIILSVGRLIKSKKIDLLISIFEQTESENWLLWIVGDGPEREYLKTLAKKSKKSNQIIFFGNQKEVENFYSQANIFAMTSISEGFPNVLLEAHTYGLPCIAFNCSAGPSDIIIHGRNGFLIEELDVNSYIIHLKNLMNDVELRDRLSKFALQDIQKFNINNIGQKFLEVLLK
jgi:GalNAc-alpha-(1->4)-GalNAc-alpha-(1->3)-diNAcBac-PP-undecaprenol alpha-1,4-N-acetyl-D-galactosaminyltransferase